MPDLDPRRLVDLIPRLAGKRILVVGDLVLDEYIIGGPTRVSREAPVIVLHQQERFTRPGAATNPAANIRTLGGDAIIVGVVGDDLPGATLRRQIEDAGICADGLVVDGTRPTITKTRILARGPGQPQQHVARVDHFDAAALTPPVQHRLVDLLLHLAAEVDAILLSDYRYGVIVAPVIQTAAQLGRNGGKLTTVDSQGDLYRFRRFSVVKANKQEAERVLATSLDTEDAFARGGQRLQEDLQSDAVVITRGPDGMSLIDRQGRHLAIPVANRSEVFDVTGAGDTVIAVMTLALTAGATVLEATHLANFAAGLVVRRLGVATVTPDDLERAVLEAAPGGGD